MGVAGLWDVLRPAQQTRSLSHLAIQEGFTNKPLRGFRIGIDASIWFFHAAYGREGENPELRTLFFRCARLMNTPFLPLFVFDGPKRPNVKRGKRINKDAHWMVSGMKNIIEAFGYEWRTAPGEAEAELAYLNRIGVIDGVMSDDVDNFLFGATLVLRNPSATLSGNKSTPLPTVNHTIIFDLKNIKSHPTIGISRPGMILIGLLSGGDYHQGLDSCGPKVAFGLAKCGFGETLVEACSQLCPNGDEDEEGKLALQDWLVSWRASIAQELLTNSQGHLPSKRKATASLLLSPSCRNFPDIDVLLYYTNPVTSVTDRKSARNKIEITWDRDPDIGKIAALCELYFEWGWKDRIIYRFRTVLWEGTVCRILRRAVVQADRKALTGEGSPTVPSTPRKHSATQRRDEECGTPSKMIEKHFSSMSIDSPFRPSSASSSEALITQIHSTRTHISTDHLLEYRLEIAPAQLVRLAEAGIKGTRRPPDKDDVYSDDDEGDGEGGKKSKDPKEHMRVWMPADMVKLVEPGLVEEYEEMLRAKEEKKANKGKGRKKKDPMEREKGKKVPAAKGKKKATKKDKDLNLLLSDDSMEDDRVRKNLKAQFMVSKPQAQAQPKPTFPVSPISKPKSKTAPKPIASGSTSTADTQYKAKKKKAVAAAYVDLSDDSMDEDKVQRNLKTHFMVSKPTMLSSSKAKSAANSIPSGSNSASAVNTDNQHKARSKPPAIPHIPLYDTSEDESHSTVRAISMGEVQSRASPKIIPIDDIFSPISNKHGSSSSVKTSLMKKEPAPFPMDNLDFDYGDSSFVMDKDDPSNEVPLMASPSKPSRKKNICSSDSDSPETRMKKSPRHSKKQSSPRKQLTENPSDREDSLLRPGSPSPMRTVPKSQTSSIHPPNAKSKPAPRKPTVAPKKKKRFLDNGIIDISSDDDLPPPSLKVMEAPLLRARAKTAGAFMASVPRPPMKAKAKSALTAADLNTQIYDDDIIDLT